MKPHFAKRKLMLSAMQLRLIGAFAGAAAATSLFQIYLINKTISAVTSSLPPEAGQHIPSVLTTNVAISIGVLTPVLTLVGLVVTHRVAGPAMRMERYLRALADGKPEGGPCRIRETDELQSLCEAINLALDKAREESGAEGESSGEPTSEAA